MSKADQAASRTPAKKDIAIYLAGHRGMVGAALERRLVAQGFTNIVTRSHRELELTDQQAVRRFFQNERIDMVLLAAAKVGGIHANHTFPADFLYQNLMIEGNVIHEAFRAGVTQLLFLGSSCIYPKLAPQPLKEEYLLTGPLEPSNEPYAIAKIAGLKLCESYNRQYGTRYLSVMPTNLYGPHDNFHLENSHVIPALLRKCHLVKLIAHGDWDGIEADVAAFGPIPRGLQAALGIRQNPATLAWQATTSTPPGLEVWGSGLARREFLHVDDMAAACLLLMGLEPGAAGLLPSGAGRAAVNIGTGTDVEIREAAAMIQQVVGLHCPMRFDPSRPDGTPQKLLDVSTMQAMGWRPSYSLAAGLAQTYDWYCRQSSSAGQRTQ